MKEIEDLSQEVKRLSNEVSLLTGLVRELGLLVEEKVHIIRSIQSILYTTPELPNGIRKHP